MKRPLVTIIVALIALVAAVGCDTAVKAVDSPATSAPPTSPPDETGMDPALVANLQTAVDSTRSEGNVPGAIVLVSTSHGAAIITSGTVGEGEKASPTPNDRTRIGSLTKTMTATILLQLVQEGKVSLDDPVRDYLDATVLEELPNADTVTLLELVHMTSGIEPYSMSEAFQQDLFADPEQSWTPEALLAYAKVLPAKFTPPGSGWQYSNTNYILLGMVIEKVTGQPLSEAFQDRLFVRLGMTNSSFPEATVNTMDGRHFRGVTEQGQPDGQTADATDWNPSEAWAAGAVVSTLADLEKWAKALYTGEGILEPETQQLRRDSILFDLPPLTATSGYGIGIGDNNGWWGHDGQIPGYTSSLQHNYDTDTTIIVLTNSDIALPGTNDKPGPNPAPAIYAAVRSALG